MSKRPCPSDECDQAVKKQLTKHEDSMKCSRKIRSVSSERTLQLLYRGASKIAQNSPEHKDDLPTDICFSCNGSMNNILQRCWYCDKNLCLKCTNVCSDCCETFCENCTFTTLAQNDVLCYSCYH